MSEHRIKAAGGNRALNLRNIADALDDVAGRSALVPDEHRLRGYAEQLRIVAAEVEVWQKEIERLGLVKPPGLGGVPSPAPEH